MQRKPRGTVGGSEESRSRLSQRLRRTLLSRGPVRFHYAGSVTEVLLAGRILELETVCEGRRAAASEWRRSTWLGSPRRLRCEDVMPAHSITRVIQDVRQPSDLELGFLK